jgi:hypothetical protein
MTLSPNGSTWVVPPELIGIARQKCRKREDMMTTMSALATPLSRMSGKSDFTMRATPDYVSPIGDSDVGLDGASRNMRILSFFEFALIPKKDASKKHVFSSDLAPNKCN